MEQNQTRSRVHQFLETLATGTHASSSQARIRLARKISERTRMMRQRRRLHVRMRELTKSLETKEAEIVLVDQEINQLETYVQDGTDQSSSEDD